jgi:ferredoxin
MRARHAARVSAVRLMVDPIRCEAVGVCAQLAPGLAELDRWGYPLLPAATLTKSEQRLARRAVRGCPRQALALVSPADQD